MKRFILFSLFAVLLPSLGGARLVRAQEKSFILPSPGPQFTVLAGGTTQVRGELRKNGTMVFSAAEENSDPGTVIVFTLSRDETASGESATTMLTIKNPFSRAIKFRASIRDMKGRNQPKPTCPVRAKGVGMETWDFAVHQLVISEVHLLGKEERRDCVE